MRNSAIASALSACLLSACFTTQLHSGQPRSFAPTASDRQWFTLGGLVQLSGAAGEECPEGMSWVESGQKATDVLITIGMMVAGGIAAGLACELPENPTDDEEALFAACQAGVGGLFPLLIASRSVEYQCKGAPNRPGIQVPTLAPVPGGVPAR